MRRMLLVPVTLGLGLVLPGCQVSAGKTVDKADVEQQISSQLGPQLGGTPKSVTCPDDLKGEKGATMKCKLVQADGAQRDIVVTVTSVEGKNVKFDMKTA